MKKTSSLQVTVQNLKVFVQKHPLVGATLLIGIIEAPITFYSGIFLGKDLYLIAVPLYCISTLLWVISTIIYFKLLLKE